MFTNWQWIIILTICVIAYILAPSDNSKTDYRDYDCYDKSGVRKVYYDHRWEGKRDYKHNKLKRDDN